MQEAVVTFGRVFLYCQDSSDIVLCFCVRPDIFHKACHGNEFAILGLKGLHVEELIEKRRNHHILADEILHCL